MYHCCRLCMDEAIVERCPNYGTGRIGLPGEGYAARPHTRVVRKPLRRPVRRRPLVRCLEGVS